MVVMACRVLTAAALLLGGVAAPVIFLCARVSAAGPEPARFAWVRARGADACATQAQIADRVAARLGRSPFAADAGRSIEVIVTRDDRGFHAEIYERGRDGALAGMRALGSEAATCAPLEDATVLAIALAIDPDAALRPPAPAPPPPSPTPKAPPSPVPAPPPPVSVPAPLPPTPPGVPSSSGLRPQALPPPLRQDTLGGSGVALRFGVGLGLLPKPAPGLGLAGLVEVAPRVQVTGEALWLPEARSGDGHTGFGLAAFALGACFTAIRRAVADLAGCASVWAGALHAVVYDLTPASPGDWFWAAAAVTSRLRVRLSPRLYAELGVHLIVPITARPFEVRGWTSPAFQETPVTGLPFVGLGAHFP